MLRWMLLASLSLVAAASAAEWTQFRGPNRDGICPEKGLISDWSKQPPKLLWTATGLGKGFASITLSDGLFFTVGQISPDQMLLAFDLKTREKKWATRIGAEWVKSHPGSRGAAIIDGDRIYALGAHGDLLCVEKATGKEVWRKNLTTDFGGSMMSMWGYSESPLIDGDKVVVTPGAKDAALVALNKKTGATIWKTSLPAMGPAGKPGAGYCSMIAADIAGHRQYIQVLGQGAVGVAAATGKVLWTYNKIANPVANIPSPAVKGNLVFLSSGYKTGSALLRLTPAGSAVKATEIYWLDAQTFLNHHGGFVLVGEHVYGGHGQSAGLPVCVELATGKVAWKAPAAPAKGSAAVLYADGHLIFRYEREALVALIEATPKGYTLKGTFKTPVEDGPAWAHPVILDGKLYLRTNDALMCYDVKK